MKKIVLILAILLCATFAFAADDRNISVNGYAEVEVPPDTGNLQLGFSFLDTDLAKAKNDMTAKMDALVEALKAYGVSDQDVLATQLNISPRFSTANDGSNVFQGYYVSRSITVVFKDLTQTDAILDAGIQAGANTFYGLNFSYSKEEELQQEALTKAIANANDQANFLANSFGVKLGSVINITAMQSYMPRFEASMLKADAAVATGQGYTPGNVKISAQISVVYAIDPQAQN